MRTHQHHTMKQSSIEAFEKLRASGKLSKRQQAVLDYLITKPAGATRSQIAQHIGVYPSSITAAVKDLIAVNRIVEMQTRHPCPITGENVTWLIHMDRIKPQGDLFGGVQ